MPLSLRLRFALVCVLLRLARAWAGAVRGQLRGRAFGGSTYRVWMASQEFGFDGPFDYPTVAEQPPEEAYPLLLKVSKTLVLLALRVPLPEAGARWPDLAALDRAVAGLGVPAIVHRLGSPTDARTAPWPELPDPAFLRLRRDGPHAHWVRRDPDGGWIVDYREILAGVPVAAGRHLEPAALHWGEDGPAIHLRGAWVRPGPGWADAKRLFHLAEIHVHEAVSHLLWTHLYAEQVIIAVVTHLPAGHPIREVLAPHFAYTLQANQNSGGVLLGHGGVFDRLFSSGWPGAAALMARGDKAWRYARMVPRRDALDRGVLDVDGRILLPDYPGLEDALLVWDVVQAHVDRHVARTPSGATEEPDAAALAWAAALHAVWGDRGWPACTDRETLVELVSACAFLTVRHTLVNAQQYPMYGYPPLWQATMPTGPAGGPPERPLDQLPTVVQTLDTLRATFAFSIQYNRITAAADPAFAAGLAAASATIAARNRARPVPYGIADPPNISASLNA